MSPIPETDSLRPNMFEGLEGEKFVNTLGDVVKLSINTESVALEPPNKEVEITNQQGIRDVSHRTTKIGMSKAFLIRGKNFGKNTNAFLGSNFIPEELREIGNNKPLSSLFEINLLFDEEKQIISVKNGKLPDIKFQHDGLSNPIDGNTRFAIFGLAISPINFWKDIQNRGLIVGILFGQEYDISWKIKTLSISIPDYNGIIKYGVDMGTNEEKGILTKFSVNDLCKANKNPKISKIYKSLNPIGILIDNRSHKDFS